MIARLPCYSAHRQLASLLAVWLSRALPSVRLERPPVQGVDPRLGPGQRRHVPLGALLVGDGGVDLPEVPRAVRVPLELRAVELGLAEVHQVAVLGGGGEPAGTGVAGVELHGLEAPL